MSNQMPGTIAGYIGTLGYVNIVLEGVSYKAHLLAFLYMKGKWPEVVPDHENRVRSDNRWLNLREATRSQNRANAKKRTDNTTGYTGVTRFRNKFQAVVSFNKKKYHLGTFDSVLEAHEAYKLKAKELFGEFYHNQRR